MPCLLPSPAGDPGLAHPAMLDPWDAAALWGGLADGGVVMAVLTATHGPAYRNAGAAMAIAADGRYAGTLTSGCVESDLILRAAQVRSDGQPQFLRYGEGSPFFDLRLPCGGAVEVMLYRVEDQKVLTRLAEERQRRRLVSVLITPEGRMSLGVFAETRAETEGFRLGFRPGLRFLIFGTGAEASTFAGLARGMDYEHILLSHEENSLAHARAAGSPVQHIASLGGLAALEADADTAVVLFYHDHHYEPAILQHMLTTEAFYIGAQGSRATQAARLDRLAEMGISREGLARLRGPIGLIPSARDPRALAVSVLAEVVGAHAATSSGLIMGQQASEGAFPRFVASSR